MDILFRAMTDKMGTMFECLHPALEDKNVGSVNTDIGADFCSLGLNPLPSARQPGALQPKQAVV